MPEASVVLWVGGEVLHEEVFASDRNHNAMIFTALEKVLERLGQVSLDLVIVGTGPGSYSGTRIGISAGQGVAIAHGCPAVGLGSFAATAVARESESAMAVGDARRGVYFVSRIGDCGEAMGVELIKREEFLNVLEGAVGKTLFTFDTVDSLELGEDLPGNIVQVRPEARYLLDVWHGLSEERRQELQVLPLSPTYLRAPFTSKAKSGHPLLR